MTVQEIIDGMIRKTTILPLPRHQTCDHLIIGRPDLEVTGIVTTFMATVDVIRRTHELGANFIISHEPTWFTGQDDNDVSWCSGDPVYERKRALLEEYSMAVWRFHDHMHMDPQDGIYRGFDEQMGWAGYRMPLLQDQDLFPKGKFDGCYEIPERTLESLAKEIQEKLHMPVLRSIGDPKARITRVAVLVGGGSLGLGVEQMPMELMHMRDIQTVLCGDITEWTLPAYVRDAYQLGMNRSILVLGHEKSEEPGMYHLPAWLKSIAGEIPVTPVPAEEPFSYYIRSSALPAGQDWYIAEPGEIMDPEQPGEESPAEAAKRLANCGKRELFAVDVTVTSCHDNTVEGVVYRELPFEGSFTGPLLSGMIGPGGVDRQCMRPGAEPEICAGYDLIGERDGKTIRVHVENRNRGGRWKPTLRTSDPELAWLNGLDCEAVLEGRPRGPVVHIFG